MGQTGSKDKRGMPVPSLPVPPGYAYPPGQGQGQGYLQAHLAPGFVPQQTYAFPPGFVPQHGYMPMAMPVPVGYQQPIMPMQMQMQMPQPQANTMPQPQIQPQPPQAQPPHQQPVPPPQRSATHGPTKGIMKGTKKNPVHPPGAAPPPQPVIPPPPVIPDPPPPVMPTTAASPQGRPPLRRTHTPFQPVIPADPDGEDDDDDDDDDGPPPPLPPQHMPNRRTPTRATRPPRTRRTQSVNVPRPSSAQQHLSRGASLSLSTPLREAPAPPRDVFKDPENREVLERLNRPLEPPQLTRSLTVSAIPAQPFRPEPPQPPPPPPEPVPQKKKSILRAFSRRSSAKPPPPPVVPPPPASAPPEIYIYPVPNSAATSGPPNSAVTMPIFEGQPGTLPVPPLPNSAPPDAPGQGQGPARGPAVALLFNENTEHSGFLNHSPHRIFYDGVSFPSALHLAEAMKFLPHRRDLADQIRNAQDIAEAYAVAAEHSDAQDPTWSSRYLEIMEEVLFLKFSQNADLRQLLSDTGDKRLIYNDPDDEYWSNAGGKGQNCLGVLLERVRDRLRRQ